MSDVSTAPAPAPAAPASAPANEVPISTNQVHAPEPVGPQAPDKPPETRRETIQRAMDRADANRKVEAARPRMGHNNPPEEMKVEREKPKPPPIDLRKRPDDQPKAPPDREPQPRAEHGHYASRQAAQSGQQAPRQYVNPLPHDAPFRDPPQRISEQARAEWHQAPESVRGAVYRMHQDFGRAYQQYRADHEEMQRLRPYQEMARQSNIPLDHAFANYVSMEHKLRNDVIAGLDLIVNNLNLRSDVGTPQERKLGLVDVAWHIVNQTPEQYKLIQAQNRAAAQHHQLAAQQARIDALENAQRQQYHRERFTHTRSLVDRYADSGARPRFDELGPLIEQEIKLGFNLEQAYRRAELLRPATHAAQTRTHAPQTRTDGTAAQTRTHTAQTRTDRSISGAPDGGGGVSSSLNGSRRRPGGKPPSVRDSVASAIRRVQGL